MAFLVNSTKDFKSKQGDPMVEMSRMMRASMRKEDYIETFDLFAEIIDYLPEGWVPVPMRLGTRKTAIYIFHESDPTNYIYYDHVNFMVGKDKLSITEPNMYYSEIEDLCGIQPSYKHYDDVRLEIPLTKDFFDYFWPQGKNIRDYVAAFSAFYFDLSGCLKIYSHRKRSFTVDGVSVKSSKGSFNVKIQEFSFLFSSEYKEMTLLIQEKMDTIVYDVDVLSQQAKEEDKKKEEKIHHVVQGLYLEGECLIREVCSGCISLGCYFEDELVQLTTSHWKYKEFDILAPSYGLAINLLLSFLLHKYHDKSTVMSMPFLPDKQDFGFKEVDGKIEHDAPSVYKDFTVLNNLGVEPSVLAEACEALDLFFKDNVIRYYLKLNGGSRTKFKILDDLRVMPDRLYSVYPMIYEFYNRVYWIDVFKLDYEAQWDLIWSAIDSGFEFIRVDCVNRILARRKSEVDYKFIDKLALCPLTGKPLVDSVYGHLGRCYDRVAYTEYVRLYGVDPGSREYVRIADVRPNLVLNELVSFIIDGIDSDKFQYERYRKLLVDD